MNSTDSVSSTKPKTALGKCLLVDDLSENLVALRALLSSEPVEVLTASSGTEALELLLKHDFALALIDVQMPEMDGFELAELMRGSAKTHQIPIIFVTAGVRDRERIFKAYEAGAVDFLFKPLEPQIVRSKIRVFLELHQQKNLLEQQGEALKKAIQTRDEFLSIASHELKTPLTSLKLQLQMLSRYFDEKRLDTLPPERLQKMLTTSNRQVLNLNELIDDLLDVSRMTNGKLSLRPSEMDLSELVQEVLERFAEQLRLARCTLDYSGEPGILGTWDRQRIEQVIVNLVSNALKYGAGSNLNIRVKRDERHANSPSALLIVRDGGIGIAKNKIEQIFDRFERAVSGSSIGGLGLGLYISRQIVTAHSGTIEVQSELNKGSTFTVTLPLAGNLGIPSISQ
ncbi:MAG: hybrid sensor histidine kinase/response regulator [Cryobacterium sp.]|nr:hybrid sensor histidine kinase/response regulator [Oligoflexia bacterium]